MLKIATGRSRTDRTPQVIKPGKSSTKRDPLRKQKIVAAEENDTQKSISRIIKKDLELGAFERNTRHFLTAHLKKKNSKVFW